MKDISWSGVGRLRKVGTGATKGWKSKESTLERQSPSEVKMGRITFLRGSSKDSEDLQTSLLQALKTDLILSLNPCMGSGTLPEITVCEHSSP